MRAAMSPAKAPKLVETAGSQNPLQPWVRASTRPKRNIETAPSAMVRA